MKYYIRFATKQMMKNKLITLGSISSMVVGLLGAVLIYTWVNNELSTDQFHKNIDHIYMAVSQQSPVDKPDPIQFSLFFGLDYSEYPEVVATTSTHLYNEDRIKLMLENQEFRGRGLVVDSTFFQIFDFEMIEGDRETILNEASNLILTESMARKIFGDKNPLGQTLKLICDKEGVYQVAGIMKDTPSNSSIDFDFLVPVHSQKFWGSSSEEFILGSENFDQAAFNEDIRLKGRTHKQFKESLLSTVAFKDVYFDNPLSSDLFLKFGNRDEVNTLIFVAIVVLLVSIFNFANLQTTHVYSQLKTRGIKQVNGATRFVFFMEVLVNRLIYVILGFGMTLAIFELVKPGYLSFLNLSLSFSMESLLLNLFVGAVIFVVLAQFITVLQTLGIVNKQGLMRNLSQKGGSNVGKVLTTIQYVFAITLIVVTGVIFKQFHHMQNKDLGFKPDQVVSIKFFERPPYNFDDPEASKLVRQALVRNYKLVKSELLKIPGVRDYSQGPMPLDGATHPMSWKLSQSNYDYTKVNLMSFEPNYGNLFELEMIEGRFFADSLDRSRENKVVINRAAMDYWGLNDIEGAKLASSSWGGEEEPWQVIGVVEDFHYEHLSKKIEPLVMVYFNDVDEEFLVRLTADRFKQSLSDIEELFDLVNDTRPFSYNLLESKLQQQYEREEKLSEIFVLFTLMGLMISSIGLFTFSLYETRKRIKEIGVRKVIGATVPQITQLLSVSFVKWVLVAFVIAAPISWWLMKDWLSNFANQTPLSWWLFPLAGIATMVIALLTVIGQTYLAAKQNPVDSLRYE